MIGPVLVVVLLLQGVNPLIAYQSIVLIVKEEELLDLGYKTYPGPYVDGVPFMPFINEWTELIYLISSVLRPKYTWDGMKIYLNETLTDVRDKESDKSVLDIMNCLEKVLNCLMENEDPTNVCVRLERAGLE